MSKLVIILSNIFVFFSYIAEKVLQFLMIDIVKLIFSIITLIICGLVFFHTMINYEKENWGEVILLGVLALIFLFTSKGLRNAP